MAATVLVEESAGKELQRLPPRLFRQVVLKILELQFTAQPVDSTQVGPGYRIDSGEYRILYLVDAGRQSVRVVLIAKRDDDTVYQDFLRRFN